MAKTNEFARNTFKSEKEEEKLASKMKAKSPKEHQERILKIAGLILITFSVFLFYAFTSFLFSWKFDQNLVTGLDTVVKSLKELNPDIAKNGTGLFGAYLAHLFMVRWFGVASYLFILLFFIIGFKFFFDYSIWSIKRSLVGLLFSIFWLSIAFGLIFYNIADLIAGAFGIFGFLWLKGFLGTFGTVVFLIFVLMIFLMLMFNVKFSLPNWKGKLKETDQEADYSASIVNDDDEEEIDEEEQGEEDEEQEIVLKPKESIPSEVRIATTIQPLSESIDLSGSDNISFEVKKGEGNDDLPKGQVPIEEMPPYDPTLDLSNYKYPPLDILTEHKEIESKINTAELEERKNLIVQTLKNYSIEIDKIMATIGPTVTLYEIIPAAGVRISKIKNLEDDIALSLSALGIRIIAPIPGKGTIGIEVPNTNPEIVPIRQVLSSFRFVNANMELPFALGKNISNEVFVADLTKMPHLLIAGATGQGKSVGLNTIIASLLYKKHPSQVKFVMVDPKKVELSLFQKIENHFLAKLPNGESSIITDVTQVITTLQSLTLEMDSRYLLLRDAHVRNIVEYNKKFIARRLSPNEGHRYLPYIVLVIDELADLMMTAGKEVEMPIARLAQLARAIGIHLIVATQRPSVNIITGTIKANFPARIAFKVSAAVDSRTIIDSKGAEQLIGRGDMLFSTGNELIRLQCAFIDTPELERVVDFISVQQGYSEAHVLPEVKTENGFSDDDDEISDIDPMFEEAARIIVQHQQGSTSLLQRRLKLGYNRAGRIIDQLERAGIVGPFEGSKARSVNMPDEYELERFLKDFRSNRGF